MTRRTFRGAFAAAILSVALIHSASSVAQNGLRTIRTAQGGTITYGQVDGETTEAGAMGAVLRNLHQRLGDKPQVGKLFDVRGTNSVATFFTVTRSDQAAGKAPLKVAGLLIATKVSTDHVEAALVTDDATHFSKSLPQMMKTLMAAWHPLAGASASGPAQGGSSAPAAPLRQVVTQDRSAAIGLPAGWQLNQQMSQMGSLVAGGPRGESAEMGITFLASDPRNPHVQQTIRTLQSGGLRNTSYASATYYQYGADQARTFVDMMQGMRKRAGLRPATYNFTSVTPMQTNSPQHCTHLVGTSDFQDGKGRHELNALYCAQQPDNYGNWLSSASMTTVPEELAASERNTLGAILQSFQVDQRVVQMQADRIAAPAIAEIHAIGAAVTQRINATHEAEAIHNSSVYKQWDSNDKRSQEFENYQLGYEVVNDTSINAHGTFYADDAALLVEQHPEKYEYVAAPNYWKGIDY
jgi:hypothetical protein